MTQKLSDESDLSLPPAIPAVPLTGSRAEKLRIIEASIAHLKELRPLLVDDPLAPVVPELRGRYLNAPVWPWFAAGWIVGALFVLMFVLARALA